MFKPGDKLRCRTPADGLIYNDIYTVKRSEYRHTLLEESPYFWNHSRFVKVEEMTATKVFMVYNNTNRGTPRVTHQSFEDAKNEAIRLATVTPNCEFLVLQATYSVKRIPQYTTEEKTFNICS